MADSDERPSGSERPAKAPRLDRTATPRRARPPPAIAVAFRSNQAPTRARPAAPLPAPRPSPAPAAGAAAGAAAASAVGAAAAGVAPTPTPAPTREGEGGGRAASKTSHFKGVSWRKDMRKWHAQIWEGKKYRHLGYFVNKEAAARAFDAAAHVHKHPVNFAEGDEPSVAAAAEHAAAAAAARVPVRGFDSERVPWVLLADLDKVEQCWSRRRRFCCLDLADGPCPSPAMKVGGRFLRVCEDHAVLVVKGDDGSITRLFQCSRCGYFKKDWREGWAWCTDCREGDNQRARDWWAGTQSPDDYRATRSRRAEDAQKPGASTSAEGAQSGAPPGGGDERTTCCADGCSAVVEMVKGKRRAAGCELPTVVCKHHKTTPFTMPGYPGLPCGYCKECGGTDGTGAVALGHVAGTSMCSTHAALKAGHRPALHPSGERAGTRREVGQGDPPRGDAARGGGVRLSFVGREADVFRYADVVRYAVNTGMHTVKLESGVCMAVKLGDAVVVEGERAEWVWVKDAPPRHPRAGDACVAAGCDRDIIKGSDRSWLPVCQVHYNAASFPTKGGDPGTLYRCCRGSYCSGWGRVKPVAKFHSRCGTAQKRSCDECCGKDAARRAKKRAANVEDDAQVVAAALATGPSCVPRSAEDTVKRKGSRRQVLDEADAQRAAGLAKYRHMLKDLVTLYKEDPDGFDKKLEGMFSAEEAEEAAMVRKLVREAVRKPSLLGA